MWKDPHTETLKQILHKWLKRILIQRSCTYKQSYRILIQVVQKDLHTEIWHKWFNRIGPTGASKDPDAISHNWSDRILMQVVQKDPDKETLIQRSSTSDITGSWCKWSKKSGPTGSWRGSMIQVVQKDLETEILHKWSDQILMQVVRKAPDTNLAPDRMVILCFAKIVGSKPLTPAIKTTNNHHETYQNHFKDLEAWNTQKHHVKKTLKAITRHWKSIWFWPPTSLPLLFALLQTWSIWQTWQSVANGERKEKALRLSLAECHWNNVRIIEEKG